LDGARRIICAILWEPRPPGEDGGRRTVASDSFGEFLREAESFPPLSYEKKGCTIDLSFWRAPERLFDEPDEFVTWPRVALAAARRVATKREGTTPRRKSKPQNKGEQP